MPEQITRLLLFFCVILLGYFVVRPALTPETYGLYGRYRAAALMDIRAQEPVHAGQAECLSCHEERGATLAAGRHGTVRCESCHAAGGAHAADPDAVRSWVPPEGDMRAFCGVCHHDRTARPAAFPVVDVAEHNTPDPCTFCHDPHDTEDW